jgi:hypothetical protein
MRNSFFPGGIKSVQTPIEYEETNRDYVERLERQLAQYIALKIEQHRLDTENKLSLKTRWNKVFADKIKKNLFEIFENYKYRVRPISTHKEISPEELKQARIEIYNINEVKKLFYAETYDRTGRVQNIRFPFEHAFHKSRTDLGRDQSN